MRDEDYIKKLNQLAEGTDFPPSKQIIKSGLDLLDALRKGPVYVPVVQNANGYKGPYKMAMKKRLESIEGRGMYSRVEELFQMDVVHVTGMYTVESKFQNGKHRHTCYVIELK